MDAKLRVIRLRARLTDAGLPLTTHLVIHGQGHVLHVAGEETRTWCGMFEQSILSDREPDQLGDEQLPLCRGCLRTLAATLVIKR